MPVAFGLNRFDFSTPQNFAIDVARAERLGWDYAFVPANPLAIWDPYLIMATAGAATSTIKLAPLIENPVSRPAPTIAGSINTVDQLLPGRVALALGVGDTAVRFQRRRPARVAELEEATVLIKRLLAGEAIDFGAAQPGQLRGARPVPVWIAAGGPRTLRMAGRVADGVFIRVGRHPDNLRGAITEVHNGAREAGRDPAEIKIGAIFHTILTDDLELMGLIGRCMAAGYYEYSPMLFDRPGIRWTGAPVEELKRQVWPDFHHTQDYRGAGVLVDFLPEVAAQMFSLQGSSQMVADQINEVLSLDIKPDIVVPHPVLTGRADAASEFGQFQETFATEVIPRVRAAYP